MKSSFSIRVNGFSLPALLNCCLTLPLLIVTVASAEIGQREVDFNTLMTKGKLEADLGSYESAASTFAAIADNVSAPAELQWEALVRYGLVCSSSGRTQASIEAFRTVATAFSEEPAAVSMLMNALASGVPGKVWVDFRPEFEELLRSAEIVTLENIGMGETQPKVAYLKRGEIELKAIWRPTRDVNLTTEVAAYELDKILELDMVPPTVKRGLEGQPGTLQLWVHGCRTLKDVTGEFPGTREQKRQFSRVRVFDYLIANQDRNLANILIDPKGGIVLVDHSETFSGARDFGRLPEQFDRELVERVQTLSKIGLQVRLEGVLLEKEIISLLERGNSFLGLLDGMIAEKGESEVYF